MWPWINAIPATLQRWATGILAVLALVGGAFLVGRKKGSEDTQQKADAIRANENAAAMDNALAAAKERSDAELEAVNLPSGRAADRLRDEWSREDR